MKAFTPEQVRTIQRNWMQALWKSMRGRRTRQFERLGAMSHNAQKVRFLNENRADWMYHGKGY